MERVNSFAEKYRKYKYQRKIKKIYKGLVKIARTQEIDVFKIEGVYNYQRHKLYLRAYKKNLFPNLIEQDLNAYKIIKRYFQIK